MLRLLVVQPTALCNLDCSYCYVPDRLDRTVLPLALLEKLLLAVKTSDLASSQPELKILWHAGEPLAAGIDFFRKALRLVAQIAGERWRIRHSLQTNGTLLTPEWCDLFQEHDVAVGVSLDGPVHVHDANRRTRSGRGSFTRVMRGIDILRTKQMVPSVLAVLTSKSIALPDDMFHFFHDNGLHRVAFNVEEIEGPHLYSSLTQLHTGIGDARLRYRAFMQRVAVLNKDLGWPLTIREFTSLAGMIASRRANIAYHLGGAAERRLGAILTMTRDGTVYSWSPELASASVAFGGRFALGHIATVVSVDELLRNPTAIALQGEIDRGVEMCRSSCGYFALCGGGSPGNKFYERGTFATTETLKCALQVQEMTEVILATFGTEQQRRHAPLSHSPDE